MPRTTALLAGLLALVGATAAPAAPCPDTGATLDITLGAPSGTVAATVTLSGALDVAACEHDVLAIEYATTIVCPAGQAEPCRTTIDGLLPGQWIHRIEQTAGEAQGRLQARRLQLLDASAGRHQVHWEAVRSVATVTTLEDTPECSGCLRAALRAADTAAKPALVQFAPDLSGTIVLSAPLPPIAGGEVILDALDTNGRPHTRVLDGNGFNFAALRLTSARNRIVGLRVVNVGGNSDSVLVDGPAANDNRLEQIAVLGRALETCDIDGAFGCVVDGVCRAPTPAEPRNACGDDGIAVRDLAGTGGLNWIVDADVRGAFDKGIKVSDEGAAVVVRSLITGNADGGLQATLGGQLIAVANEVRGNRGTTTASGLAANGSPLNSTVPARLITRGNLAIDNALRGISVRSRSIATLRDDFLCGNGTVGRDGIGLAVLEASGGVAEASARGLAMVHNLVAGAVIGGSSLADLGTPAAPGDNAFTSNGAPDTSTPANLRNNTPRPLSAVGNFWQHCGPGLPCDEAQVEALDVTGSTPFSTIAITPARGTPIRQAPQITAIDPPFAMAGELVRLYGSGFDAITGAGNDCADVPRANACPPRTGTCVMIDRQPAEVVAATPTMLVIRAPFTCVQPVPVVARTRWSLGFGRATFCTVPPPA